MQTAYDKNSSKKVYIIEFEINSNPQVSVLVKVVAD